MIFFLTNIHVRFLLNIFELFISMFFIRNVLNAFYKNLFYKKQILFLFCSKLVRWIFLNFCMKLEDSKCENMALVVFPEKILFFSKWGLNVYKNFFYKKQTYICGFSEKLSTIMIYFLINIYVGFLLNMFKLFIRLFIIRNITNTF